MTVKELSPEQRLLFEERAAIMEYDGNNTREAAEKAALVDILKQIEREAQS